MRDFTQTDFELTVEVSVTELLALLDAQDPIIEGVLCE
jgi:hypothetical protein